MLLVASVAQAVVAVALAFADPLAAILALTALLTAGGGDRAAGGVRARARRRRPGAARGGERADGGRALRGLHRRAAARRRARRARRHAARAAASTRRASPRSRSPPRRCARAATRSRTPPRTRTAAAGMRSLLGDRVLRPVVLAAVGALLFISASMTAEVFYVKDVLGAGDAGYAAMFAAWTLGMVFGALALPQRVPPAAMATVALVALALQGAGMAAQTAWAVLPAALAGYLVGGVGHGAQERAGAHRDRPARRERRARPRVRGLQRRPQRGRARRARRRRRARGRARRPQRAGARRASARSSRRCSAWPRYATSGRSSASAASRPASSPARTTPESDSSRDTRGESAGGRMPRIASWPSSSASSAARRAGRSR